MSTLIKPKDLSLSSMDGETKHFRISRVPAIMGREIFTQYIPTATPKIGDYKSNESLMKKLLSFVEIQTPNGQYIKLDNEVLINSHITDWEMLIKLEMEMVKYNTDFFSPEKLSAVLDQFNQTLPQRITKILSQSLDSLSQKGKRRSKS